MEGAVSSNADGSLSSWFQRRAQMMSDKESVTQFAKHLK